MAVDITYQANARVSGANFVNASPTITPDASIQDYNQAVNGNTVEFTAIDFDKTKLQYIYVLASGNNATAKFNNNSVGDPEVTLVAGTPFQWVVNTGLANPFANNVSTLFVTATNNCTISYIVGVNN